MVLELFGFTVALRVAEPVVTEVAQPVRTVGFVGSVVVVVLVEVVGVEVVVVEVDVEVVEVVVDVVVVVVVVAPCFVRTAVSTKRQISPPESLNPLPDPDDLSNICVKSELTS